MKNAPKSQQENTLHATLTERASPPTPIGATHSPRTACSGARTIPAQWRSPAASDCPLRVSRSGGRATRTRSRRAEAPVPRCSGQDLHTAKNRSRSRLARRYREARPDHADCGSEAGPVGRLVRSNPETRCRCRPRGEFVREEIRTRTAGGQDSVEPGPPAADQVFTQVTARPRARPGGTRHAPGWRFARAR